MEQRETYSVPVRLGGLATAEVAQSPSGVAEHAELAAVTKKGDQRLEGTTLQDKISALWAVTSNVTKGPYGLLADIGFGALKQLDKDGHGAGVDDDLCLLGGTRGNVGQGPGSLELDKSVRRAEEFDETADDVGLDDLLDGRVALFRQELAELCCGGNLVLNLL
jgi:hypothetical protein